MSQASPDPSRSPPHLARWAIGALGAAVLVAVVCAAVWLARNAIGERAAVAYLQRMGVSAQVRLTRLDAGGVAGTLRLGSADRPALTASRFEAEFAAFAGPGAPQIRRLTLRGARLRVATDGRSVKYGELQGLVDSLTRGPAQSGPGPDVDISDSEVLAQTPLGPLTIGLDARVRRGVLADARLVLRPTSLKWRERFGRDVQGVLDVRTVAGAQERYAATATVRLGALSSSEAVLGETRADLHAELPYRPGAAQPLAGAVRSDLRWSAATATIAGWRGRGVTGATRFAGVVADHPDLDIAGAGDTTVSAAGVAGGATWLVQPKVQLAVTRLAAAWREQLRGSADFDAALTAPSGRVRLAGENVRLASPSVRMKGRAAAADHGVEIAAAGSLGAKAGLDRRRALALAGRIAPGEYGADVRGPLAGALTASSLTSSRVSVRTAAAGLRLRLDAPLVITSSTGGRLRVSQGPGWITASDERLRAKALALDLSGGGFPTVKATVADLDVVPGLTRARLTLDVDGSAGPLRGLRANLAGALTLQKAASGFSLAGCGHAALAELSGTGPQPVAQRIDAEVCSRPSAPLLRVQRGEWRVATSLRSMSLTAPGAGVQVTRAEAAVDLAGRGPQTTAVVEIAQAAVADTTRPLRFSPLGLTGPLRLAGERWSGDLSVALAATASPLGRMSVNHDLRQGAGSLTLAAPSLVFAPDGLQPATVLPGLAPLGTDVAGRAAATLSLGWRGVETQGAATVRTDGLQIRTAAGLVKGARFDLVFTSLDPLTSPPGQHASADRLEAIFPLTDLSATFSLGGQALDLAAARAAFQGGALTLDPMRVPLTADATFAGAVRLRDVQLGAMLESLNLSQAARLEARVSGDLPFTLSPKGVVFTHGRFAAVEPGRLTLRREALTGATATSSAPAAATPVFQDLALQALEDLAFTELDASVDSRPNGRLGIVFHVKGRHDPPVGKPARIPLLDALRGKAFDKPLPLPKGTQVDLTLDSSLNLDELLAAYPGLPSGSVPVHP